MQTTDNDEPVSGNGNGAVLQLSLISVAPMVVLAVMLIFTNRDNAIFLPLLDAFKTYSAVSLSFLGGMRWGLFLFNKKQNKLEMAATLLPAAIGWISLFLPDPIAIGLLLLAICAMGAWDNFYWYRQASFQWYGRIRIIYTLIAAISHVSVLMVVL